MNILVTGGFGFIGFHLVDALLKKSNFVRVLDNLDSKNKYSHSLQLKIFENDSSIYNFRNFSPPSRERRDKVEFVFGDIRDRDTCMKACSDIDVVFHNAAIVSLRRAIENPKEAYGVNVVGTLNLLNAAIKSGVKRFIFSSSAKIYGNTDSLPTSEENIPEPTTPYAITKVKAESHCKRFSNEYGLNIICLRYFSVYGPGQQLQYGLIGEVIDSALNGGIRTLHANENMKRDFTYIKDIVEANLLCLDYAGHGYDVFNIGSGKSYSLRQLIEIISQILGRNIIPVYKQLLEGTVVKTHADISKARKKLCYYPKTNLQEGLRHTINWAKEKYLVFE